MTLFVTRSIGCDWPDCVGEDVHGLPGESATTVRRDAAAHGWRRIDGKDYCPRHREEVRHAG